MNLEKPKRVKNRKLRDEYHKKRCSIHSGCIGHVVGHHLTTVKSGGSDSRENLVPLCIKHHDEIHKSLGKFCDNYPKFQRLIESMDRWDLIEKMDRSRPNNFSSQ